MSSHILFWIHSLHLPFSYTGSCPRVSHLLSETFLPIKLWHILTKGVPEVLETLITKKTSASKVVCYNNFLYTLAHLINAKINSQVVVECLSICLASEGWKENTQYVNYLMCLLWTASGCNDHTGLLPNFTGWGVPAALPAVLCSTALFLKKTYNKGTQWCYPSALVVSLSFIAHCYVDKFKGRTDD